MTLRARNGKAAGVSTWPNAIGFSLLLLTLNCALSEEPQLSGLKFAGSPSCASTSCHGGGTGRNEALVYQRRDQHAVSYGILSKGTSLRIAEALNISGDPAKDSRCIVCHAPMQGVSLERLPKNPNVDRGVGCESCHGPAEKWLLFHTRPDASFQQSVAAGMRDLNDIYGRANACVGCHLNLEEAVRKAGHPELYFELDGQCMAQPPHYRDARPSLGPRSWLTGQAVALRETSWKLALTPDPRLLARWKALVWLLRKTELGRTELPESGDYPAMQSAADGMARKAARATWTSEGVAKQLKVYVSLYRDFVDPKTERVGLQRMAEVLVSAMERLWAEMRKSSGSDPASFEAAFAVVHELAQEHEDFEPERFSAALGQLEIAFARTQERAPASRLKD